MGNSQLHKIEKSKTREANHCHFWCLWNYAPGICSSPARLLTSNLFGSFLLIWERMYSRKFSELWWLGDWFFHHNNTPSHTSLTSQLLFRLSAWCSPPFVYARPSSVQLLLFLKMKKTWKEAFWWWVEAEFCKGHWLL